MSLPVILPPNTVSVYGHVSLQGITSDIKDSLQFGIVDQIPSGAANGLIGQSVLFKVDNAIRLNYNNSQYFLIQQGDIILTENVPS